MTLLEQLPHLTDEELEQLSLAVDVRVYHMRSILATAKAPEIRDDAQKALQINLSLSTAISEARMALARRQEQHDRILASLTKAAPGEDGLCVSCHKQIKRVPGGQGPTWIHTDTQAVICEGQDY